MSTQCDDERALLKDLLEIHGTDGIMFEFDSKYVLALIERVISVIGGATENGDVVRSIESSNTVDPGTLRSLLHKISCVLSCNCSGRGIHEAAMKIIKILSDYEWGAKITIIFAAFVADYAQFLKLTEFYTDENHRGMVVANLKHIEAVKVDVLEEIKSRFNGTIDELLEVIKFIGKFYNLPSKHISKEEMADALLNQIPVAVYKITRVVVACASKLNEILVQNFEISSSAWTMETSKFSSSKNGLISEFQNQYEKCRELADKTKETKFLLKLKMKLKTASYSDNQKILELLFINKRHSHLLAFGPADRRTEVGVVEALKGKTVLLFISDLDCIEDQILILKMIHQESRSNMSYEIVWLPIVNEIGEDQRFEDLMGEMPWHSLKKPSLLKPGVVRFVKEEWHFSGKPILVALDQQGKVANPNALPLVSTWGNAAYPFTQTREIDTWSRKEWSLDLLLVGVVDRTISEFIKDQKVICFFGGKNRVWINNFITTARDVETKAAIKLGMVYIGTDRSELSQTLNDHNIHYWEPNTIEYFWQRIQFIVKSGTCNDARASAKMEYLLHELSKFNKVGNGKKSDQGWALISQGAGVGNGNIAYGNGDDLHEALSGFEDWTREARCKGFVPALKGIIIPEAPQFCKVCRKRI